MFAKLLSGLFVQKNDAPGAGQCSRAIQTYLASHSIRKLHLGAGPRSAQGWLGTDIAPSSDGVVYLNATEPFPIEDDTFDYVFSEHMIEHMSWQAGLAMLEECHRILKPGGTIRVATPDLAVLLGLYGKERNAAAERYVRWIVDRAMPGISAYRASFVINNAFRSWGHQFLYDGELLLESMRKAGFTDCRRCAYGESGDHNLRGIESHGRNIGNEEIAIFETMIFEADRPRG